MSALTWSGQQLKVTFEFKNGLTYTTTTNSNSDTTNIVSASFKGQEQTQYNNIFGSVSSNNIVLQIWDANNYLDNSNLSSPYANYMEPGTKVVCKLISGSSESNFGTYRVTEWKSPWSDGIQEFVEITLSDELTYICNKDIPELPTYNGIYAGTLISTILVKLGIAQSRIHIDDDINTKRIVGVAPNEKVGYFLNDICKELCAIVEIDENDNIYIMKALSGYKNRYNITDIGDIIKAEKRAESLVPYTRVRVSYNKTGSDRCDSIGGYSKDIETSDKEINNISIGNRVQAIGAVILQFKNENTPIALKSFSANQNTLDLSIACSSDIEDIDFNIIGKYKKSNDKYVYSKIKYDGIFTTDSNISYDMTSEYAETENDAQAIADNMARYIEMLYKKIELDTMLKPSISVGSILNISGIQSLMISGNYKVIESQVEFGEQYSHRLTVVPMNSALWDDSESWDDQTVWNDYSDTLF